MPPDRPSPDPPPLRIAVLVRTFPAPSETFITDHLAGLRERGHDVRVFARQSGEGIVDDPGVAADLRARTTHIGWDHSSRCRLAIRGFRDWARTSGARFRALRAATRLYRRGFPGDVFHALHLQRLLTCAGEPFDLIHAHFGPNARPVAALKRAGALSIPLLTTFHGFDVTSVPDRQGRTCYEDLFRTGEAFTVNSPYTRTRLEALGAPTGQIALLPMGVDPDRIPFRERHLAAADAPRVLTVARLEPVKGLRYGLRAIARLLPDHPDLTYTIVGGGSLRRVLEDEARDLGIRGAVRFTGVLPFPDVLHFYDGHDLFLLPGVSLPDGSQEAQGRVLIEAQAAGMPIVATDVGGVSTSLSDGAGILVPERDPAALAQALTDLLEAPERWPAMGRAGRQHVRRHFARSEMLDCLIRLYRALTDG